MRVDKCSFRALVMMLAVVVVAGSVSGCATMRRKFVRKRKAKDAKEVLVPILQPEEYAPVVQHPIETYQMHYTVCKAYFGDLWDTLGRGYGDKRERYLLNQIAAKIDSMADLLKDDQRAKIKVLSAKVLGEIAELDKPNGVRRYDSMKRDLRAVETSLRREFKPDIAGQFLK